MFVLPNNTVSRNPIAAFASVGSRPETDGNAAIKTRGPELLAAFGFNSIPPYTDGDYYADIYGRVVFVFVNWKYRGRDSACLIKRRRICAAFCGRYYGGTNNRF